MAHYDSVYWGKGFRYFHEMLHDAYTPEPVGFPESFLMGWRHAQSRAYHRDFGKFSDLGLSGGCPGHSRVPKIRVYGEHRG